MNDSLPEVSVIIPTRNRSSLLSGTLNELCRQTYPATKMEVVVVLDGCSDNTLEMLHNYSAPFTLKVLEVEWGGAGASRNTGASSAHGELLIFLDDDIWASPQLIEAHVEAHQHFEDRVVIGYLKSILTTQKGLLKAELRCWWEANFIHMRQKGHRFSYKDLLSGNFSIQSDLFFQTGGFSPDLKCHEDYEFGYRLIQHGATFLFAQDALGYHQELTNLRGTLARKYQEGIADVFIGRQHPDLKPELLMKDLVLYSGFFGHALRYLTFDWPQLGERIVSIMHLALALCDRVKLRSLWRHLLYLIMNFWYWHGVAQKIASLDELESFLNATLPEPSASDPDLEIDLALGIKATEKKLDEIRPASVRVRFGEQTIGILPVLPGCERWRGAHLRLVLASDLAAPMLRALALEGIVEDEGLCSRILQLDPLDKLNG